MKKNEIILIIAIGIFVILFSGFIPSYNTTNSMYNMMSWMLGSFGFMWVFGYLFMILIVIALVLLIIWLIKQINKK